MTGKAFAEFMSKNQLKVVAVINSEYVLVENRYGKCKVKLSHLQNKVVPTIQTSVDKNNYFINQAQELHGNLYIYNEVDYVNSASKIKLICREHGEFYITPNQHLSRKVGCPTCSKIKMGLKRRNTLESFITKANQKHNAKYNYTSVNYNLQNDKVKIICPDHGEFFQTPKDHLSGNMCPRCAKLRISEARRKDPTGWKYTEWVKAANISKEFDSFKIYIIKCQNHEESFIKIGRTYKKVNKRFRTKSMLPYEFKVLQQIEGDPQIIFKLEKTLKDLYAKFKYIPRKTFNGMHECFNSEIESNINCKML